MKSNHSNIIFRFILDKARESEKGKFIDWNICDTFADFGGVRIEDDVRITKDGCVNMS